MAKLGSSPVTIVDNVQTWLKGRGWEGALTGLFPLREDPARLLCWFNDCRIPFDILTNREGWKVRDPKASTEHYHGVGGVSYRERGVSPSAQLVLYPTSSTNRWGDRDFFDKVYLEVDFDISSGLYHAVEVITNAVTRGFTDQQRIATLLAKRFPNA